MVIRRIRHHIATHNWFAVSIDLLIVVVGVFLGTQANNWNEVRIERGDAAEYRREIIEDLKANEIDLRSRKAYYGVVRDHAIAALAALESPAGTRGEPFLIHAYQASQVWARPLARAAYDEMVGAGLSRSIGDQKTRSRLTAYYTQIKQFDVTAIGTTAFRERIRQTLPYTVQSAIRIDCGDRVVTLPSGAQVAALPDRCDVDLSESAVTAAVSKLESADLTEDLTRHIADVDQKLAGFDRFGKLAHDLRVDMQAMD
jgi:hypothetical protein